MRQMIILILGMQSLFVYSQDVHFTQINQIAQVFDPSATVAGGSEHQLQVIARNQWQTIPVSYNAAAATYAFILPSTLYRNPLAFGAHVVYDIAGQTYYNTLQIGLSSAYSQTLGIEGKSNLRIGANLSYNQRSYNFQAITQDVQFNSDFFDPSIPVEIALERAQMSFLTFALGLGYDLNGEQFRWSTSFSAAHLNAPRQNFIKPEFFPYLNAKYVGRTSLHVLLNENFGLNFLYAGQFQGLLREHLAYSSISYFWESSQKFHIFAGVGYRVEDALIFNLGYEFGVNSLQLSFDLNNSPLSIASNHYGGLELSYGIRFGKSKDDIDFGSSPKKLFCPRLF